MNHIHILIDLLSKLSSSWDFPSSQYLSNTNFYRVAVFIASAIFVRVAVLLAYESATSTSAPAFIKMRVVDNLPKIAINHTTCISCCVVTLVRAVGQRSTIKWRPVVVCLFVDVGPGKDLMAQSSQMGKTNVNCNSPAS